MRRNAVYNRIGNTNIWQDIFVQYNRSDQIIFHQLIIFITLKLFNPSLCFLLFILVEGHDLTPIFYPFKYIII